MYINVYIYIYMYTTLGHTLASTMVAAPSSRTSFSTTQPPTLPTAERCHPAQLLAAKALEVRPSHSSVPHDAFSIDPVSQDLRRRRQQYYSVKDKKKGMWLRVGLLIL
jgi:hypothetical protein